MFPVNISNLILIKILNNMFFTKLKNVMVERV